MEVVYLHQALNDREFWYKSGKKSIQERISQLIESIKVNPFQGIGKPEPLKYGLTGKWSRRISHEHRLVYQIEGNRIFVYSMKGNYR